MAKRLNICMATFALFLIIATIVIVTLIFTVFKPKDPVISVHLADFDFLSPNLTMNNVTLGMVITIANPNFGSFKYQNSIGYITYHDTVVGSVPVQKELVPARSEINVSTSATFMIGKLMRDPQFWTDVIPGMKFNLTSTTELPGKAIVLNYIKLKARASSLCDISVDLKPSGVKSSCISKIKLF